MQRLSDLAESLAVLQAKVDRVEAKNHGPGPPRSEADQHEEASLIALLHAQRMEIDHLQRELAVASPAQSPQAKDLGFESHAAGGGGVDGGNGVRGRGSVKWQQPSRIPRRSPGPSEDGRHNAPVVIFKTPALGMHVSEPSPSPYIYSDGGPPPALDIDGQGQKVGSPAVGDNRPGSGAKARPINAWDAAPARKLDPSAAAKVFVSGVRDSEGETKHHAKLRRQSYMGGADFK